MYFLQKGIIRMVVDTVLKECIWTPYGVQCNDDTQYKILLTFLRELILDRHLYINKAIGFRIHSTISLRRLNALEISRHENIGESYVEMSLFIQDKIFLDNKEKEFSVVVQHGDGSILNSTVIGCQSSLPVSTLYQDPHICTVLKGNCTVFIATSYNCGYTKVERNSRFLTPEYMPVYTDYSVQDYVRVLPPMPTDNNVVQLRYFNGMNENVFRNLLTDYALAYSNGKLKAKEKKWLLSFGQ